MHNLIITLVLLAIGSNAQHISPLAHQPTTDCLLESLHGGRIVLSHCFAPGAVINLVDSDVRWSVNVFSQKFAHLIEGGLKSSIESDFEISQQGNMVWFEHTLSLVDEDASVKHAGVMQLRNDHWSLIQYNVTTTFLDSFFKPQTIASFDSVRNTTVELSVMSFNIRYGTASDGENSWPNRKHLVFQLLKDYDADFVGLQEALYFQLEEILASNSEYFYIGVGRDDGQLAGEFAAILYKPSKFKVLEQGTYWFCDQPDVPGCTSYGNNLPRIATWGHFQEFTSGFQFVMENCHMDHQSQPSREQSTKQLINHVLSIADGETPFVVTGDFNCNSEQSPDMLTMKDYFDDSFRVLFPNATDVGTIHNFSGSQTGTKIDYVFSPREEIVGGEGTVKSASILYDNDNGQYPSDHFPVLATIVLTNPSQ